VSVAQGLGDRSWLYAGILRDDSGDVRRLLG
jgi:hypothetical protein